MTHDDDDDVNLGIARHDVYGARFTTGGWGGVAILNIRATISNRSDFSSDSLTLSTLNIGI